MNSPAFLILLLIFTITVKAQSTTYSSNGFLIPADIKECITQLDLSLSKKAKDQLIQMPESHLSKLNGLYLLHEWAESDSSAFVRYFERFGITVSGDRHFLVLLAYKKVLEKKVFDLDAEVKKIYRKNDSLQRIAEAEYDRLIRLDTIQGFYIPADLSECMKELDKVLKDDIRQEIMRCNPQDIVSTFHMTTGLWIRNSWGLWKGSRLRHHLTEKGIDHPDGMSSVILRAYLLYLKGNLADHDKVIKDYLPEYKKMKDLIVANEKQMNGSDIDPVAYREFIKTKKITGFTLSKY